MLKVWSGQIKGDPMIYGLWDGNDCIIGCVLISSMTMQHNVSQIFKTISRHLTCKLRSPLQNFDLTCSLIEVVANIILIVLKKMNECGSLYLIITEAAWDVRAMVLNGEETSGWRTGRKKITPTTVWGWGNPHP